MALQEHTKAIIKFLQANNDKNYTATAIGEILGLSTKQVDGSFTTAITNKKLGERVKAEIQLEDGTHKPVKFLKLNQAGMAIDVDAPAETDK